MWGKIQYESTIFMQNFKNRFNSIKHAELCHRIKEKRVCLENKIPVIVRVKSETVHPKKVSG